MMEPASRSLKSHITEYRISEIKMATVKPFRGFRPPAAIVEELSCLPYDVMNSEEAARMADGRERSLLRITRAEIECPPGTDIHSDTVYNKAVENFEAFKKRLLN